MQVEVALERAEVARRIGRVEEAQRLLGTAVLTAPDDPRVLVGLAELAFDRDDYDEAIRLAGQAVLADPDTDSAHVLIAMASSMLGRWDPAAEHAATAIRLRPHDPAALLLVAWLSAHAPRNDPDRARWAVTEALALAPDDAGAHCSAAEIYERLGDTDAMRRHIAAGLAIDPAHVDLLRMHAQAEFSGGDRPAAVATLRGLLAHAPTDGKARRLLAEVHWRALLRLAAWVWAFAGCYAAVAMWAPALVLRVLSPLMFAALPYAWWRVFRTLRGQLPPGYLRTRVRAPRVVLALVATAGSGLLVDVGAVAMRSEIAGFVRLGGLLLVLGAFGAACGHLLIFTAWLRSRVDDPDPDDGFDFALTQLLVLGTGAFPVVLIAWLTRGWARQPGAFGALVAAGGIVVGALVIEAGYAIWRDRRQHRRLVAIAVVVLVLVVGAGAAVRWGGGELVHGQVRGRELFETPTFPTTTRPPLPTIPSRFLQTTVIRPPVPAEG
ncbi:tetratricopeptide repeat protein [Nocardia sp. AG03]|uniref:tetratricopeptide repeat protein n=1 Tax=Nocardia sp. AG03 TaxID=3025312 RepID=UPI002418B694|nr:tetratricopeptide repeat protein [Nocardia sp. AG03]